MRLQPAGVVARAAAARVLAACVAEWVVVARVAAAGMVGTVVAATTHTSAVAEGAMASRALVVMVQADPPEAQAAMVETAHPAGGA